ncbi:aldose epimerase family protein [Zhengella sp. ZM62]|uniref:aldose epimerase family protein n=1 Tax=Zhengella sedimenti TaxID=3390035 RepID=UPI003975B8B4
MTDISAFGTLPDGSAVDVVRIEGGGLAAAVLTYGAVLQDLRLAGHKPPLVLGFDTLDSYLAHSRFFGATAGRCANRIRDGRFTLDGRDYQLDRNFLGKHHLHGGSASIGKRIWTLEDAAADSVTLSITLADGEMGYPGAMVIRQAISLQAGGVLDIELEAHSDAPTLCNLAHHSYFNLDGTDKVLDHDLQVLADHYLPVDGELIPTGEIAPVDGLVFDLRRPRRLRGVCDAAAIDHNFCLANRRREITHVATLSAPLSGVSMDIRTTEPGLQVYDGGPLDVPVPGLDGRRMGAHAGMALEPQVWPDAINHPAFPQAVLRPGESYRQHTQFVFRMGHGA